jgi:5-methylcytosine-specific restriction endonuclease McrA
MMERVILENLIADGLTQRQIAEREDVSQTNVRYWLKRYGLKTRYRLHNEKADDEDYECACGETDPDNFYGKKRWKCKACWNEYQREVEKAQRLRIIEYFGGCCAVCGFKQYAAALQVHHLYPEKKDVAFASMRKWAWERVLKEIRDCVLLCSNCHSAFHAGQLTGTGVLVCIPVSDTGGTEFDSPVPD